MLNESVIPLRILITFTISNFFIAKTVWAFPSSFQFREEERLTVNPV
jgi:hypothetical protein